MLLRLKAINLSTTLCRTVFLESLKDYALQFEKSFHTVPSLVLSPNIPSLNPAGNRTALPVCFPKQAGCLWRVFSLSAAGDDPMMAGDQTTAHTGPSHKRTCPPETQR